MGYKVTNKNVIVNREKNIAMDNVFFFSDRERAEEYVKRCEEFHEVAGTPKEPAILEECTPEEDRKYLFDQYHEEYNPNDTKMPNIVIERPIEVEKGVPYWVTRKELLISF